MNDKIPLWERETPLRLRNRWEGVAGVSFPDYVPPTSVTIDDAMVILNVSEKQARELLTPLPRARMIINGHVRYAWYKKDVLSLKSAMEREKKAKKSQKMQKNSKTT